MLHFSEWRSPLGFCRGCGGGLAPIQRPALPSRVLPGSGRVQLAHRAWGSEFHAGHGVMHMGQADRVSVGYRGCIWLRKGGLWLA